MKKVIPIILAIIVLYMFVNINNNDYYIIPEEAIRLRIIANSNTPKDQYIKRKVKLSIEEELRKTLSNYQTLSSSRKTIKNNMDEYEKIVSETLKKENYSKPFNIKYGYNYFPEKEYKGVIYEAGEYESLVITLGEGEGDNWWCVLFPPLCTLEVEEADDVEYRFFIKDFIEKYLQ